MGFKTSLELKSLISVFRNLGSLTEIRTFDPQILSQRLPLIITEARMAGQNFSFKIGCLAKMGNDWYKKILISFLHNSINF